jgi:xanthine dehydrogenase accessory factor
LDAGAADTPIPDYALRMLLATDGTALGTLGDPDLDAAARMVAADVLDERPATAGLRTLEMPEGREVHAYVEVHEPTPDLVIVGAGHIAQPLSTVGRVLGFRVRVLDDRPHFATGERFPDAYEVRRVDFADPFAETPMGHGSHVVLVTRGHKYDFECLRRLVDADPAPAYIGMIGSRRRVRATFVQLLDEGVGRDRLARVRAPVGLDVGAQSPAEIAVSVGAELVQIRRGGSGTPLSVRERILERFFPDGSPQTNEAEPDSVNSASDA